MVEQGTLRDFALAGNIIDNRDKGDVAMNRIVAEAFA